MRSESLRRLSDRLAGHILTGQPPTNNELAAMAQQLMEDARIAAVLETLPFDVTAALLNYMPETPFVRTALGKRQT
jgi:hypothetical protein